MEETIARDPLEERPPASVMDRFGNLTVANHIADLKVFIGNQVARRDKRVCLLAGKIFTLPLHFQMLLRQVFPGFLPIGRFLLFSRETATQPLEFLLSFAVVPWVVYRIALGVGQEGFEPNIYANLFAGWNMLNFTLGLDTQLAVVAIGTPNNTYPLDIFDWKGLDVLFLVSNQPETTYAATIREGDMFAIIVKLPTSRLVLYASIIVLELWIAFLPWLLFLTVLIEAGDSEPCTISTCLTSLRVEARGKWVFFGKDSAVGLQVVFADTLPIHPQTQTFVANELDNTYRFFNGSKLLLIAINLVLVDQHEPCFFLCDMLLLYIIISVHGKHG